MSAKCFWLRWSFKPTVRHFHPWSRAASVARTNPKTPLRIRPTKISIRCRAASTGFTGFTCGTFFAPRTQAGVTTHMKEELLPWPVISLPCRAETCTHTHTRTVQPTDLFYLPPKYFKGSTCAIKFTTSSIQSPTLSDTTCKGFTVSGNKWDSSHNKGIPSVNRTKSKPPFFMSAEWCLPTFNNFFFFFFSFSEMIKIFYDVNSLWTLQWIASNWRGLLEDGFV